MICGLVCTAFMVTQTSQEEFISGLDPGSMFTVSSRARTLKK